MQKSGSVYIVENEKFTIGIIEDCIFDNRFREGVHIESEDLIDLKYGNMQLAGDKPYCVMVSAGFMTTFSPEAMELAASREFAGNTRAKALIVGNVGQKIFGNFYVQVNKPHIRTKLFTDRAKAIDWLKEQLRLAQ